MVYEFFSVFSHCASQSETTFYETKISPKALHQSCKIVIHIVILFSLHHEHVCFEILNQPFAELQSSLHVKGWVHWKFLFEAFGTYNRARHTHLAALIILGGVKPGLGRTWVGRGFCLSPPAMENNSQSGIFRPLSCMGVCWIQR